MVPHYFFFEKPDGGQGVTVTHPIPESEFSPLGHPCPVPALSRVTSQNACCSPWRWITSFRSFADA